MACSIRDLRGDFPRLATLIIWMARPQLFSDAFGGSWFWPLLGIVFLPFTTLMYVLLWSPATGVAGGDWFWLGLAVLLDLMHWGGSASRGLQRPDRIPDVYSRNVPA